MAQWLTKCTRGVMKNQIYLQEIEGFTRWMTRINYTEGSIKSRKRHLNTFFSFLTSLDKNNLETITNEDLDHYNKYLHNKPIATKTIEAHISALKLLNQYRALHGQPPVMRKKLSVTKTLKIQRAIVSKSEINGMYEACEDNPFGWRDKIILSLYYGCGLRYREGAHVEQKDVNFHTGLLHIIKGKNYRERYVPMSKGVMSELRIWIEYYQNIFTSKTNLIISSRNGKRIKSTALNKRIKTLVIKSEIDKRITLHSLRHSIATHLMEEGMKLEDIGRFLGHVTLETTQKYAHIID